MSGPLPPLLVAEDDEGDAVLLQRSIQRAGIEHPVVVVPDGEAAIGYLEGTGAYADRGRFPLPLLLLLDLKMPRRSGFEVLEWLRGKPELERLPVIVLTGSRESNDIQRAYALGANSYLVKPGTPEELVDMVRGFGVYWLTLNEPPEVGA